MCFENSNACIHCPESVVVCEDNVYKVACSFDVLSDFIDDDYEEDE